jgi:hypothetical protein
MHITIDVNIRGLEGLANLFSQIKVAGQGPAQHAGTVVQMPTQAPMTTAPVLTGAAAPQLSVVPSAPVQAPAAYPAAAPAPAQTAVPVAPPQAYTEQQLAVAATQLMDAGRQPELVNLLAAFGVQALTQLPKEQYGNFATQLRAMGARI